MNEVASIQGPGKLNIAEKTSIENVELEIISPRSLCFNLDPGVAVY